MDGQYIGFKPVEDYCYNQIISNSDEICIIISKVDGQYKTVNNMFQPIGRPWKIPSDARLRRVVATASAPAATGQMGNRPKAHRGEMRLEQLGPEAFGPQSGLTFCMILAFFTGSSWVYDIYTFSDGQKEEMLIRRKPIQQFRGG